MNAYSQILGDVEAIENNLLDHIKRVAYDAQCRWENVTRLGADLATAATSYVTALGEGRGHEHARPYLEALEAAIDAYRQGESGGFAAPLAEDEGDDTDYTRGWRDGEAAEKSRWEARASVG